MTFKNCSNPEHAEPLPATSEFFYKDKRASDGLTARCKDCLKARQRRYYKENREDRIAYQRDYNRVNQIRILRWRMRNLEHLRCYQRHYYRRRRAVILPRQRSYQQDHRTRIKNVKTP